MEVLFLLLLCITYRNVNCVVSVVTFSQYLYIPYRNVPLLFLFYVSWINGVKTLQFFFVFSMCSLSTVADLCLGLTFSPRGSLPGDAHSVAHLFTSLSLNQHWLEFMIILKINWSVQLQCRNWTHGVLCTVLGLYTYIFILACGETMTGDGWWHNNYSVKHMPHAISQECFSFPFGVFEQTNMAAPSLNW